MSLVATVVDPLTGPVPDGWDDFVHEQRLLPVWSSRLLRAADWCAQTASSMVLVADAGGGQPVATFHTRHLGLGHPGRFVQPGRVPVASLTECRTTPATTEAGLAFAASAEAPDRLEAVRVFERAIRDRTGPGGLAIAYRNLLDQHLPAVPAAGRVRLRVTPRMVVHNEWSDLAGYLASVPGKWRSQLRKISDTVRADPSLRYELVETIDAAEAGWLAEVVRRRYAPRAIPRPPLPASYFAELSRLPGSRFLTYRDRRGRLVGYSALHDNGRELLLICWGSRGETDGRRGNLYFDQYLRLVELMVRSGRHRLILGPGMQRIKARYGARPQSRWALVGLP